MFGPIVYFRPLIETRSTVTVTTRPLAFEHTTTGALTEPLSFERGGEYRSGKCWEKSKEMGR